MKILAVIGLIFCLTSCIVLRNNSTMHIGTVIKAEVVLENIFYVADCDCGVQLSWAESFRCPGSTYPNYKCGDRMSFFVDRANIHYIIYKD